MNVFRLPFPGLIDLVLLGGMAMKNDPAPRGALFQQEVFLFTELEGAVVERFLADVDETGAPIVLLLKPQDRFWYWFFLDAGYNFWFE